MKLTGFNSCVLEYIGSLYANFEVVKCLRFYLRIAVNLLWERGLLLNSIARSQEHAEHLEIKGGLLCNVLKTMTYSILFHLSGFSNVFGMSSRKLYFHRKL